MMRCLLPLTDPWVVDLLPLVVDMPPFVVYTLLTATIVPRVEILPLDLIMHVSTYVPPEYADLANAFVILCLESVHTVF